ncbi:MAG: hypothetical protein JO263_07885 [Candidatus Eremiobacteraeota bacterium]|nr:hypothetical protein [Candidatus Eremiobacteraeota bacterium]
MSAVAVRKVPVVRRPSNVRSARTAAEVRRKRNSALRYRSVVRIVAALCIVTVMVVGYLWLLANVTRLNYELAKATQQKTRLLDESLRLDDEIAHLESRERLAAVAATLRMNEPRRFGVAVVSPVQETATAARTDAARGVALLPAITDWLR